MVEAFVAAIDRGSGALINVGSGRETSLVEVFERLAQITGFEGEPDHAPMPDGELARIALDPRLAAELLDWRPVTSMDDGLEDVVRSMGSAASDLAVGAEQFL